MELEGKSKDELIEMCVERSIALDGNERVDTLRNLLKKRAEDAKKVKEFRPPKLSGKKAVINVHRSDDTGPAIFVGLNGVGYRIETGKDVEVPIELVGVLNDARQRRYRMHENGKDMIGTDVLTYPFSSRSA